MPGNIRVRIISGRGLPVMDRASETADAYVEVRFGQTTVKTDIFPKSLNPQWNSEWFKFEAEDEELQDEPLLLRVMDYDTYSANDAIGRVYVDLNPLLSRNGPASLKGWLPIYDTLHGIRGEINLIVRVDLFTDTNRFRQSSCGIDFFGTPGVPTGYILGAVQGFVEELVVNDDPEYQWIDKIRTPRASNETRQLLFSKMSGELVRKIGKKAYELGGNAVVGYRQCFDLEGQSGIVVRGIGTSVTLLKDFVTNNPSSPTIGELWQSPVQEIDVEVSPGTLQRRRHSVGNTTSPERQVRNSSECSGCPIPGSTEAAELHSNVVRQSSLTIGGGGGVNQAGHIGVENYHSGGRRCSTSSSSSVGPQFPRPSPCRILPSAQVSIDSMEFPFFTMQLFPLGMVVSLGGVVSSRSVKLLDKIENADDAEERDGWWAELRTEVRSHMRALGCNAVIGYKEETAIHEEICVLSSAGTAAVVDLPYLFESPQTLNTSLDRSSIEREREKDKTTLRVDTNFANSYYATTGSRQNSCGDVSPCHMCHIPYSENSLPFPVKIHTCQDCGRGKVPELLLTTIEPPASLELPGDPSLIQARLVRRKNDSAGETHAKEISDMLPFVEYELHSQLVSKLVAEGKNVIFGLRVDISLGETFLIGLATGTAYRLSALSPIITNRLKVPNGKEMKVVLTDEVVPSKPNLRTLKSRELRPDSNVIVVGISPAERSTDSVGDMDLNRDKNTILLELDMDSGERLPRLITSLPKCSNILSAPSTQKSWRQLQTLCRVFCTEIRSIDDFTGAQLSSKIDKLMTNTFFKFRRLKSFYMSNLQFSIILPEENEIQIGLYGVVLADSQECSKSAKQPLRQFQPPVNVPPNPSRNRRFSGGSRVIVPHQHFADDYQRQVESSLLSSSAGAVIFRKEEDKQHPGGDNISPQLANVKTKRIRAGGHWGAQPEEFSFGPLRPADIFLTPLLSWNDGGMMTYFGHYDFFFIRETNMMKELGGINCFVHSVLCEVLHVVRAHVAAVNGHGMVSLRISDMKLTHNLSRNNAQLLICVSGDIVTTPAPSALS